MLHTFSTSHHTDMIFYFSRLYKFVSRSQQHMYVSEIYQSIGGDEQVGLSLYGDQKHLYIQPSCKFIIGGVRSDAALDEREARHL